MSLTKRCRLCRELHDVEEHPELLGVCHECYVEVMEWLKERGWAIVQVEG